MTNSPSPQELPEIDWMEDLIDRQSVIISDMTNALKALRIAHGRGSSTGLAITEILSKALSPKEGE